MQFQIATLDECPPLARSLTTSLYHLYYSLYYSLYYVVPDRDTRRVVPVSPKSL